MKSNLFIKLGINPSFNKETSKSINPLRGYHDKLLGSRICRMNPAPYFFIVSKKRESLNKILEKYTFKLSENKKKEKK